MRFKFQQIKFHKNWSKAHLDDGPVTLHLIEGYKRMDVTELGPSQRNHTAGGIEFHGATAEGDHRMHEPEVLGCKVKDVTQHLSFRMMSVENWVRQIWRCPE